MAWFQAEVSEKIAHALTELKGKMRVRNRPELLKLITTHGIRYHPDCHVDGPDSTHDTLDLYDPKWNRDPKGVKPRGYKVCMRCGKFLKNLK